MKAPFAQRNHFESTEPRLGVEKKIPSCHSHPQTSSRDVGRRTFTEEEWAVWASPAWRSSAILLGQTL